MKVLVATHITQGVDRGDYCGTLDGELVTPVVEVECSDGDRCGCSRGFPGLASSFATTTAMVAELPHIGEHELTMALVDSLTRGGWMDDLPVSAQEAMIEDHLGEIIDICNRYPVGTVVCRSGDNVYARTHLAA